MDVGFSVGASNTVQMSFSASARVRRSRGLLGLEEEVLPLKLCTTISEPSNHRPRAFSMIARMVRRSQALEPFLLWSGKRL